MRKLIDFFLNTDNIPIIISFCSLLWSSLSFFLIKNSNKNNVLLREELADLNNKKHWRSEKIYTIADDLYELSCKYWLDSKTEEDYPAIGLLIKCRLQDIEDHSNSLKIDITNEIMQLREHITGGDFESSSRQRISSTHNKFLYILQHISAVKAKIP